MRLNESNYADFIVRKYFSLVCCIAPFGKDFAVNRTISVKPFWMFLLTDMASSNPDISNG